MLLDMAMVARRTSAYTYRTAGWHPEIQHGRYLKSLDQSSNPQVKTLGDLD